MPSPWMRSDTGNCAILEYAKKNLWWVPTSCEKKHNFVCISGKNDIMIISNDIVFKGGISKFCKSPSLIYLLIE